MRNIKTDSYEDGTTIVRSGRLGQNEVEHMSRIEGCLALRELRKDATPATIHDADGVELWEEEVKHWLAVAAKLERMIQAYASDDVMDELVDRLLPVVVQ